MGSQAHPLAFGCWTSTATLALQACANSYQDLALRPLPISVALQLAPRLVAFTSTLHCVMESVPEIVPPTSALDSIRVA